MSPLLRCASLLSLLIILTPCVLAALEALQQEDTLQAAAAFALDDACLPGNENSEKGACDLSLRQLRLAVHSQQLSQHTQNERVGSDDATSEIDEVEPGVAAWKQCGGKDYVGPTKCHFPSVYTCTLETEYWSSCKPGSVDAATHSEDHTSLPVPVHRAGTESLPVHLAAPTVTHTLPLGHPSASKVYPKHKGFTLWLVEEFDKPLDLDKDPIWTWSDGGLKEGQVRFVKEQIKFQDGKMKIEVRANHGHQQTCSNAQSEDVPHKPLVAGEIRTRFNMFRYGRYEVRMKAPSVQPHNPNVDGNFVSTMFVFRDASFKHWREIDVEVTGRAPGAISTNILTADYQAKWKPSMQETDYPISYQHMNVRAEYHDYAFEWLPGVIRWYVDGKVVREKRNDRLAVPDKSAKIMMNLWIYHDAKPFVPFGGKHLDKDRFPMHADYDWFRFYKWDGDHHYPPADMSSKSLTGDDMYLTSNNPCDGIPQIGEVLKDGKKLKPCKATCR
ncbi:unnamed protein product [Polarella glacialis]|uniref:GH16 domain-containing protein n=1 Tax=Polarella glacialis TaxID=89957 RepID=A0A813HJW8_POLGL|nr:unnamed protein product [Polarella glacialis]